MLHVAETSQLIVDIATTELTKMANVWPRTIMKPGFITKPRIEMKNQHRLGGPHGEAVEQSKAERRQANLGMLRVNKEQLGTSGLYMNSVPVILFLTISKHASIIR